MLSVENLLKFDSIPFFSKMKALQMHLFLRMIDTFTKLSDFMC